LKAALVAAMAGVLAIAPFPGSAGLRTGLLFLAATLVVVMQWRERDLPARPWPRGVIAAFALWCALACLSLAWSIDPRFTAGELRGEILYGATAFATFFLAARFGSWTLWTRAVLAGTLAVFVLNILQEVLPVGISRHSVLGQGGMWSTHLVIAAPLVLAMGWPGPARLPGGPVLRVACLALIVAAALQTGNRTVWVALAAELVVASLLSRRLLTHEEWRREMRPMAVAGIAIVGAFLFVLRDRAALVVPGPDHAIGWAFDLRPQIWAVAWEQFRDAPWVGHGFGREIVARAFAVVVPPPELHHPPILHAHNVFIDAALQLGVAGVAALVAVFAALARQFRACFRDRGTVAFGIIGLTLLAGFVVKNLTDDFLHRHNGLMFWAVNGLLLGLVRPPAPGMASAAAAWVMRPEDSGPRVDFLCNVCGTQNRGVPLARVENRETPACARCDSTLRQRALMYLLSMELHGRPLTLPQFPIDRRVRGLGLSDWEGFAAELARRVTYTNTYYTRAPQLDISAIPPAWEGTQRFVIASDVFEHIPSFALDAAFRNTRRLLASGGFLIFTVPYVKVGDTREFFPRLHDFRIAEIDGRRVLLNTTEEGVQERFDDDLDFHGGEGMTLAMRMFSEADVLRRLAAAGFASARVCDERYPPYGIVWPPGMDHSLPIVARA
jgi:O-antigen ligase